MTLQSPSQTKAEPRRSAIHFPYRKEGKASYCREEVEEERGGGWHFRENEQGQRIKFRQTWEVKTAEQGGI